MRNETRTGSVLGVALGLGIAFVFALVIARMPERWFVEPEPRAVLYLVQVLVAPVFVLVARWVARPAGASERTVLFWAVAGALAFDGLVLGFWPSLYGQSGEALAWTAATLLWAFAWIVVAGLLLTREPTAAPAVDSAEPARSPSG